MQVNLLFDLPLPHLQLSISISNTSDWVLTSQPTTCTAYCLLVPPEGHGSELVCAKELLSPMAVALGKMLLPCT